MLEGKGRNKELKVFSATWCSPCKALKKFLQEEDLGIQVSTYDIDSYIELAKEYNVRSVPTSIILVDGKEVHRYTGYRTKEDYLSFVGNS
jgi:thiol-disulfide isomerase/thioredoxin